MASLAQFRVQFPEFKGVTDALVTAMLNAANLELDLSVWGQQGDQASTLFKADNGQMYLAAHKLATSPFGQNAKMVSSKDGTTQYWFNYYKLLRQVATGNRVT